MDFWQRKEYMLFDIGANVGRWTMANLDQTDRIVAVEASPSTFSSLVQNCTHPKVTLLNYAVCANTGEDVVFYHARYDTLSTLNKAWLTDESSRFYNVPFQEIRCPAISLDRLVEEYGIPDLLKLDVEGGEFACLSSLTRKVKTICFEWASETNSITLQCLNHLASLGYTRFFLQEEDAYTFRPSEDVYEDLEAVTQRLSRTIPKQDWGMLWCSEGSSI